MKNRGPAVLFITETGIIPFVQGLAILGDSLADRGHNVAITKCTGQMFRCQMLTMNRIPLDASIDDKKLICDKCSEAYTEVQENYHFSEIDLSKIVNEEIYCQIDKLVDVPDEDLEDLYYKGFPVGKIVRYDFVLETKRPFEPTLPSQFILLYKTYIKNTILSLFLADKISIELQPSLFITFNEYAQCQAVRFAANLNCIKRIAMTYPCHYDIDPSRFMLWGDSTCESWFFSHVSQNWKNISNKPVTKKNIIECWKDSIFRMQNSGSHIFSNCKDNDSKLIYNKLGLSEEKKHIVVFTSSEDERITFETGMEVWGEDCPFKDVFPDQITWIKTLKEYASTRDDVQITVRIHPREGTQRSGAESSNLVKLKESFSTNYKNFTIIWADDPMSSYNLLELADICLIQYSIIGLEAVRLGIPVMTHIANMLYPNDDFIYVAESEADYKSKIDYLLTKETTWNQLLKAIRYYHWRIFIPSLDLGEKVRNIPYENNKWPKVKGEFAKTIKNILYGREDLVLFNKKNWEKEINWMSKLSETKAVCRGIRFFIDQSYFPIPSQLRKLTFVERLINKLSRIIFNKNLIYIKFNMIDELGIKFDDSNDYCLEYSDDISKLGFFKEQTREDNNKRVVISDGDYAVLVYEGKIIRKLSPMINRLSKLHNYGEKYYLLIHHNMTPTTKPFFDLPLK